MEQRLQAITACAFIYRQNKGSYELFAARRAKSKEFFLGAFELPGGHIEAGDETLEDGLIRELHEEFQIRVLLEDIFHAFLYLNHKRKTQSVEIVYFATMPQNEDGSEQKIVLNPEDHSEYRWVTQQEALQLWNAEENEHTAMAKGFELLLSNLPQQKQ